MALFEMAKAITLAVADPGASQTLAQYTAVTMTATGIDEPDGATDAIAGIVLESVSKAEFDAGKVVASVAPLVPGMKVPMVCNEPVALNGSVTFNAAANTGGRATDAAAAAGQLVIGVALQAGAAGEIIQVLVLPADHG